MDKKLWRNPVFSLSAAVILLLVLLGAIVPKKFGTGQTENGIVVEGKLSKINEKISWSYDTQNYMKPWHLKTEKSEQVSITFTPMFERIAATKAIIVRSEVHQMIGTFSGSIITDEGERIVIESLLGWAEDHEASW